MHVWVSDLAGKKSSFPDLTFRSCDLENETDERQINQRKGRGVTQSRNEHKWKGKKVALGRRDRGGTICGDMTG